MVKAIIFADQVGFRGQGKAEKAAWRRNVSTDKFKTSCRLRLPYNKPRFLWREDFGMTPLRRARCFR